MGSGITGSVGNFNTSAINTLTTGKITFPDAIGDKIQFYTNYTIGISSSSTLEYKTNGSHKFSKSTTELMSIDDSGVKITKCPTNSSSTNYNIPFLNSSYLNIGSTNNATFNPSTGQLTAISFNAQSDYRIKENIRLLNLEEHNVDNLKPSVYEMKNTKETNIGLIAHELQPYYPFLVSGSKDGDDTQSINYIGLIGVLIKEIQELKKRVSKLEGK